MKPISSLLNGGTKQKPSYSVHFDDGITLLMDTVDGEITYRNMLSVGTDTYFFKHNKWPSGANLDKRIKLAIEFIQHKIKNNRYRNKLKDEPEE